MADWEGYLEMNQERFVEELAEFVRIPSISSSTEHLPDVERAAEWVMQRMEAAGIESVRLLWAGRHSAVYGQWLHSPNKPTVLIYGHLDVQPADPLDQWESPPFEPRLKEQRLYGRGSTDDKGNMLIPIAVVEAMLKATGALPLNVKFFFEGQEEIGSPQLPQLLFSEKELLGCDLVISADGGQWSEDQPNLVLGTRGLAAVFIDVQGPGHDLHSGTFGGAVANPIHALARILASMHDDDGRITIEGFYDDVRPLSEEERRQIARVPFDESQYLQQTGACGLFGEPGFGTYERTWARPTVEVNGISGGFQGEGLKTVLPSRAHAKISCRLVADQDPFRMAGLIETHVRKAVPPGVRVTVTKAESSARPYLVPAAHPGLRIAASVLRDIYGREPYHTRTGGTIPANALFLEYLNAHTIIFAFGLPDERQHSPNEFFRLSSFKKGQKAYGVLLERLAEQFQ